MITDFSQRDSIRQKFAADLLSGHGIEIGGGAFPQALPAGVRASHYDLRTSEELREHFNLDTVPVRPMSEIDKDFPNGADFLIAHNVLEHTPNPIGELVRWSAFVRDGGIIVLSLPHYSYCEDERRDIAPVEHLIEDYLNDADGLDFQSREHGGSFLLSWSRDFAEYHHIRDIEPFSKLTLDVIRGLHRADYHWHAYNSALAMQVIIAASILSGKKIALLRLWRPELGQTLGDVLVAYRVFGATEVSGDVSVLVQRHWARNSALVDTAGKISRDAQSTMKELEPPGARTWRAPLMKPFIREPEFCFVASISDDLLHRIGPQVSVTLCEDNEPLGPSDSLHQLIRDQGGGAYSVWEKYIYLSASDNSNANTNGRSYEIRVTDSTPR